MTIEVTITVKAEAATGPFAEDPDNGAGGYPWEWRFHLPCHRHGEAFSRQRKRLKEKAK